MLNNGYKVYIGKKILLPITPEKIEIETPSQNKTYNLMNEGEINVRKAPGLKTISFDVRIPRQMYPFSQYIDGYRSVNWFIQKIEELKEGKKTFQFIVTKGHTSHMQKDGTVLDTFSWHQWEDSTNITCTLEDYTVTEDVENGFDVVISMKLKEFRAYGLKKCKVKVKKKLAVKKIRDSKVVSIPESWNGKEFLVFSGSRPVKITKDTTVYNLAKKLYGDGEQYKRITKYNNMKWKKSTKLKKGKTIYVSETYWEG